MNDKNEKKLFIIQPPKYNWNNFDLLFSQIEQQFNLILNHLRITTSSDEPTEIKLKLDIFNPEIISAYAKRLSKHPAVYEVTINAGLSYYLWTASMTFAIPEYNIIPWLEKCSIENDNLKQVDKKKILADYAFIISIYYVLLHEIAHIVLGHVDYLNDEMMLNYLNEFQDEKPNYSSQEIKIRKAFEAEADRQAGEWLVAFFEYTLGKEGLGYALKFPSRKHAYEFYVYAITAVFRVLQDLTQRKGIIHPKPNERLYILIGALSKYFKQNTPDEHDVIYLHAVQSCMEAGKKFMLIEAYELLDIINNAMNLAFVDKVIEEINIRSYQHQFNII